VDIKALADDLRKTTDELARHAGTNEAHQIAVLSEKLYYMALELKRVDDQLTLLVALGRSKSK
jgi:hypothetical protein